MSDATDFWQLRIWRAIFVVRATNGAGQWDKQCRSRGVESLAGGRVLTRRCPVVVVLQQICPYGKFALFSRTTHTYRGAHSGSVDQVPARTHTGGSLLMSTIASRRYNTWRNLVGWENLCPCAE